MKIYAIIVTYNGMQWIDKCLRCLSESTVPVVPIIVDNGSDDGTREYIPSRYGEAVWLPQDKNLGFGQANNIGMRYALDHGADYVLLINQDAYLHTDAIEAMLAVSDGVSFLTPVHLNGPGDALDMQFRNYVSGNVELCNDILVNGQIRRYYPTGFVCAACWLLPASLIRKVGGFNPLFFHYGEDNNYFNRIIYHKFKTYLCTGAKVNHDRLIHGNMKVFNTKKVRRDILVEACDVNLSAIGRIFRVLAVLYRSYVIDFPKKQYRAGVFTYEVVRLCFRYLRIVKYRRIDKKGGEIWL